MANRCDWLIDCKTAKRDPKCQPCAKACGLSDYDKWLMRTAADTRAAIEGRTPERNMPRRRRRSP